MLHGQLGITHDPDHLLIALNDVLTLEPVQRTANCLAGRAEQAGYLLMREGNLKSLTALTSNATAGPTAAAIM